MQISSSSGSSKNAGNKYQSTVELEDDVLLRVRRLGGSSQKSDSCLQIDQMSQRKEESSAGCFFCTVQYVANSLIPILEYRFRDNP